MKILRINASLQLAPGLCRWVLLDDEKAPTLGECALPDLPSGMDLVQVVLPAAQVHLARVKLPSGARQRAGSALAFSVEESLVTDPEANWVTWLGGAGEYDVLAVFEKRGLQGWAQGLESIGVRTWEVQCETLLLPLLPHEWSLVWDGYQGIVRCGAFEGCATDSGDTRTPPMTLRLALDEAASMGASPSAIAIYPSTAGAMPDLHAWQQALGIPLRVEAPWDPLVAPASSGACLMRQSNRWMALPQIVARLRPAAWVASAALALHGALLVADWIRLANEKAALERAMVARFRETFPEAVTVTDPALQMRRKLADLRRTANQPDSGDFLPMIGSLAIALKDTPHGRVRAIAYESGRLTVELSGMDEAALHRVAGRIDQSGLRLDPAVSPRTPNSNLTLTLRAP